jgi:hypothetical protein
VAQGRPVAPAAHDDADFCCCVRFHARLSL